MNKLVEYGLEHEKSDLRAHVAVSSDVVYVFSTARALSVINANDYREHLVWSDVNGERIVTAAGLLVPIADIKPRVIKCGDLIASVNFVSGGYLTTSDKGRKAQLVIKKLLIAGRFPLPTSPKIVTNAQMQRDGLDLVVEGRWRIQVKCDWRAGETGNLFIQTRETNPLKQY